MVSYYRIGCLTFSIVLSVIATARADVIYRDNGSALTGVVTREDGELVWVWTKEGEERIPKKQITNIRYDTDIENVLMMADGAKEVKNYARAYELYEKAFRLDPNSARAAAGMTALQEYIFRDKTTAIVTGYERYQTPSPAKAEGAVLADNSAKTEEVQRRFGLILAVRGPKVRYDTIKVLDVAPGSRAATAGVTIDDYIITLDGRPTEYLGLYDVVALLAAKGDGPVEMTVEREARVWIETVNKVVDQSVLEVGGFLIDSIVGNCVVTSVRQNSAAAGVGLKTGDVIVMANGVPTKGLSREEVLQRMKRQGAGYLELVIRRKLTL